MIRLRSTPLLAALALALASGFVHAQKAPAEPASAASAPQEGARPEVVNALQAAQGLNKAGKYAEAMVEVEKAAAVPNLTPYERVFVERMRAASALGSGNMPLAISSLRSVLDSGRVSPDEQKDLLRVLINLYYNNKQYPQTIESAQRYFKLGGNDAPARVAYVNSLYLSGDFAAAAKEIAADVQANEAAGKPNSEQVLRMLASAQAKIKDDAGYTQTLWRLVAQYPTTELWTDLIWRVQGQPNFSDNLRLETYRLRMATGAMEQGAEYAEMAQLALQAGYPAEAEKALEAGYARGLLGKGANAKQHEQLRAQAKRLAAADATSLQQAAANPQGDGNRLATLGWALSTSGHADKGSALLEQALAKGGLKRPEEARLHLGIAQWMAGQKEAAAKTFKSVQGTDGTADLGRLWAIFVQGPAIKTAQQ
jgi:hypothetical protein